MQRLTKIRASPCALARAVPVQKPLLLITWTFSSSHLLFYNKRSHQPDFSTLPSLHTACNCPSRWLLRVTRPCSACRFVLSSPHRPRGCNLATSCIQHPFPVRIPSQWHWPNPLERCGDPERWNCRAWMWLWERGLSGSAGAAHIALSQHRLTHRAGLRRRLLEYVSIRAITAIGHCCH